jgi:hypothetical protein
LQWKLAFSAGLLAFGQVPATLSLSEDEEAAVAEIAYAVLLERKVARVLTAIATAVVAQICLKI